MTETKEILFYNRFVNGEWVIVVARDTDQCDLSQDRTINARIRPATSSLFTVSEIEIFTQ